MTSEPFANERAASIAARSVIPPETDWSILSQAQRGEVLHRALAEAGVVTSEYEDRTAWWLGNWGDHLTGILARWITAAHEAGKAAGPDGTVTEWGVRLHGAADLFASATDQDDARRIAASFPSSKTEVVSHEVTRWTSVPETEEDNASD